MPGEIVNLNEFGMAIESLVDLPPGYELTFRLRRNSKIIELRGWSRWGRVIRTISTSEGKELKVYQSGVEFDEATVQVVKRSADVLPTSGQTEASSAEGSVKVQSPG
jgi:hypothetical protein